jgi:uncharacterized protein YndB with AHSA1/START domain
MRTSAENVTRYRTGNSRSLHVFSEVHIDRPVHAVWSLLADPERWPEWSPICSECSVTASGSFAPGALLRMRLRFRLAAIDVHVKLIRLRPSEEICWEATIWGIRIVHRYSVRSEDDGCVLTNEELFSGLIQPLRSIVHGWFRLTGLSLASLQGIKRVAEGAH